MEKRNLPQVHNLHFISKKVEETFRLTVVVKVVAFSVTAITLVHFKFFLPEDNSNADFLGRRSGGCVTVLHCFFLR